MRVETYNPETMALIESDATQVDFGTVSRGHYNAQCVVVRAVAVTETLSKLALFLEDNAGLDHTKFGKYRNASPLTGLEPGDDELSDFFVETPGVSDFASYSEISDWGLPLDHAAPEYVWMDAEVGTAETNLGDAAINLRFVFEYV